MTKLGIIVGEDNWNFFREIYADLATHYTTDVYQRKSYTLPLLQGRVDRWLYHKGIREMLRRNDICLFEWASDLLMTASYMPKQSAIITRLHSFELYDWAPRIHWDAVDQVVFVSEAMRQLFCRQHPSQQHKTVVVQNGVALDRFQPPQERRFQFRVGMLCNIMPIKRVYEAILTHRSLRLAGYPSHLHIAGQPAGDLRYAAAVHGLVPRLRLEDTVTFHGHVANPQTWLKQIDIFVSNSYWEGQQVALLEAMASGCYCLSHFWPGVEEVLPAENIFVSSDELQAKIVEYARLPEVEQQRLQAEMRRVACEKSDITHTQVRFRQVIDEVQLHRSATLHTRPEYQGV